MTNSLKLMSWNIQSGGFPSYRPNGAMPIREESIKSFINDAHQNGVESVSLVDALLWDETYGGDTGIAEHLGYAAARFQHLNDDRFQDSPGFGLVYATDVPISESRALDLDSRQGLQAIHDIGKHGLQVATVYLDDMSQNVREKQIKALMSDLEKDIPTIIAGDFNMLRPELKGATFSIRVRDLAIRSLVHCIPFKELKDSVASMTQARTGVPLVQSYGYMDADRVQMRPTAPAVLPAFGIDYLFHTDDVFVTDVEVRGAKHASDHLAIRGQIRTL